MGQVKAVPIGREGVGPYLCVNDAAGAIEFYKKVFGARELMRLTEPSGKVGHAELDIGGRILQLADEYPELGVKSPLSIGGSPVTLTLYVDDVDKVAKELVASGGKEVRAVADQFYGDRGGKFSDPFGHVWWLATHVEDLSPEQLKERALAQAPQ